MGNAIISVIIGVGLISSALLCIIKGYSGFRYKRITLSYDGNFHELHKGNNAVFWGVTYMC